MDTNLLGHLYLNDVAIVDSSGKPLVKIERFVLEYSLAALMAKEVKVDALRIEGPVIDLTVDEAGEMDLLAVFGPSEEEPEEDTPTEPFSGLPVDVTVSELAILRGSVSIDDPAGSTKVSALDFKLGASVRGSTVSVSSIDADVDLDAPIDQTIRLDGNLALKSGDLQIDDLALALGLSLIHI